MGDVFLWADEKEVIEDVDISIDLRNNDNSLLELPEIWGHPGQNSNFTREELDIWKSEMFAQDHIAW